MSKNKIIVTGGAGFVGTNLITLLLKKTKFKIISIDNYSSGSKNHIKNSRIKYLKVIQKYLKCNKKPKEIQSVFHLVNFQEFYQSFLNMNKCIEYNTIGSSAVFNFCLENKIKLIYSATLHHLVIRGRINIYLLMPSVKLKI